MKKINPRNIFIYFLIFTLLVITGFSIDYMVRVRSRLDKEPIRLIEKEVVEGNLKAEQIAKAAKARDQVNINLNQPDPTDYTDERKRLSTWIKKTDYQPSPEDFLGLADFFFNHYELSEAIRWYAGGAKQFPKDYRFRLGLAKTALRIGAFEGALSEAQKTLELKSDSFHALAVKTVALSRMGKFQQARSELTGLEKEAKNSADAIWAKAVFLLETSRLNEVVSLVDTFIKQDRFAQDVWETKVRALERKGDFGKARDVTLKIISWNKRHDRGIHNLELFIRLAFLDMKLDRATQALYDLERAISLNPRCPIPYRHLGQIRILRGETDLAKAAWKKALDLFPQDKRLAAQLKELEENEKKSKELLKKELEQLFQQRISAEKKPPREQNPSGNKK